MAMTLRLTDDETRSLREAAEREQRSMQEVARTAIREYVERRDALRDRLLDRVFTEHAELLDRLRDA